mmetsp:Transcript_6076/g.20745  ORF Transcript_6076/g.20745 Transcript_6076/m.20745 type:complete len:277 (+) Transcript_6076:230-1060(+)
MGSDYLRSGCVCSGHGTNAMGPRDGATYPGHPALRRHGHNDGMDFVCVHRVGCPHRWLHVCNCGFVANRILYDHIVVDHDISTRRRRSGPVLCGHAHARRGSAWAGPLQRSDRVWGVVDGPRPAPHRLHARPQEADGFFQVQLFLLLGERACAQPALGSVVPLLDAPPALLVRLVDGPDTWHALSDVLPDVPRPQWPPPIHHPFSAHKVLRCELHSPYFDPCWDVSRVWRHLDSRCMPCFLVGRPPSLERQVQVREAHCSALRKSMPLIAKGWRLG